MSLEPYYQEKDILLYHGDCLDILPQIEPESIQCCVTSPPYWGLRDYGVDGQLGLERTPEEYVERMVEVFSLVNRALRPDGTLWLNLGDTYAGGSGGRSDGGRRVSDHKWFSTKHNGKRILRGKGQLKSKDLIGIPWRVAFALQSAGWYLRSDIIWHKPNPMPESVTDRPTKAHEYIFLMAKSERYFYDIDAIREPHSEVSLERIKYGLKHRHPANVGVGIPPVNTDKMGDRFCNIKGRNKRTVWTVTTKPYPGAHFAVFPPELIEPCILAGTKPGDIVLDPFNGSGTVGHVCKKHGRRYIGIELNKEYLNLNPDRIGAQQFLL